MIEEFVKKCANDYYKALMRQAEAGEKSVELSNDEKFSIAVVAGVPYHLKEVNDGSFRAETEKCAVIWDGKEFIVGSSK